MKKKGAQIHSRDGDLFRNEKKSPFWIFEYRDSKGKRHRLSTKETDYSKAVRIKKTLLEKIHFAENKSSYRHLLGENFERWYEIKKKSWAPGTSVDVKGKTRLFLEYFEGKAIDEINEVSWEAFIGWMNQVYPGRRISKIQDYVSSFMKAMFHDGRLQRIPFLRDPDSASEVGRALQDWEIEKLFEHVNSPILYLQILMQLKMGMRSGEMLALSKDRIDLKADVVRLKASDTKTRSGRVIPIHPDVKKRLIAQMESSPSPWLFPSPTDESKHVGPNGNRTAWEKLLERAEIKCRRHDLRHTCATQFARDNVSPVIAARILGMSLEVFDRVYCAPNEDDLKGVFRK